jgi:hypothetical protein
VCITRRALFAAGRHLKINRCLSDFKEAADLLHRYRQPLSLLVFRRQLPSEEHGGCSGGSGEPIEAIGKLQDRFPSAGISQLPSHLPPTI